MNWNFKVPSLPNALAVYKNNKLMIDEVLEKTKNHYLKKL